MDNETIKAIEAIIRRGNDAEIRRKMELVTLAVICFLPYARSILRFNARFGG